MPLIGSSIPNFVQGVSQQAAALRLPSQNELQENGVPSLVEGLMKRPPLGFVAKVSDTDYSTAKVHFSSRSLSERYVFIVTNGDLKVFDRDTGTEKTVAFPDGKTYLTNANPKNKFRLLTIADTTFVVNRDTTVAMDAALTTAQDFQALVAVKQGDYSTRYVIYVDGTEVANVVTSDTAVSETRTDWIAGQLITALNDAITGLPSLAATYDTAVQYGSSILIKRTDGSSFNISTWDSRSDDALKVATDRVQRFNDLPSVAPDGYIVEVVGDQTNNFDNYYVTFDADDTGSTVGSSGVWSETLKPGIKYKLDNATMPHILVRETDGTFTFKKATWDNRLVGDETSAPEPSFVGKTVNGVFFSQNRLGLLADDNVILSKVASFYNFWPDTVKAVLDSDPIDVAASHPKVAIMNAAIAYDKKTILFSDQTQWVMRGGQILSPKNVSMDLLSEYDTDPNVNPVASGNAVFFAAPRGGYTVLNEMIVVDDQERSEAFDASEHVPKYIPSGVIRLTASKTESTLAALSENESGSLFVYNWHWTNRTKDQAAWHKFTLSGATILEIEFYDSELWVVYVKEGKTIIGKIKLDPGQVDASQAFLTLLDYKMDETDCTEAYDAGTDQTTITFPVPISNPVVVLRGSSAGTLKFEGAAGVVTQAVVDGNVTEYYAGERYTFKTKLSEIIYRPTNRDGGLRSPMVAGRLQLKTLSFLYEDTGYFKVKVTPRYRSTDEYIFTGRLLAQGANVLGTIAIEDGEFRVPIMSKSDRVDIEIESDSFLPCRFLSADWEGMLTVRARRV